MRDFMYRIRFFRVLHDISNLLFILRTIRKNKNSAKWNGFNLRSGWLGTVGTVINLPPEVFQGEEIYYQVYLVEQMKPINRYLESLNLAEVVYPETESLVDPEQGQYAYLVMYKPLMRDFTFGYVISRLLFWYAVYFIESRLQLFSRSFGWAVSHLTELYNMLQP